MEYKMKWCTESALINQSNHYIYKTIHKWYITCECSNRLLNNLVIDGWKLKQLPFLLFKWDTTTIKENRGFK